MTMKRLCATVLLLLLSVCAFAVQKSGTIVYINGSKFYIHTVQPGETLYGLSKAYEVGEKVILQYNPSAGGGLKAGENVKIPFVTAVPEPKSERKLRRTFDSHTVAQGETLYAISRKYEIPIQTVIEDNPSLDPTNLRLGERILIRKKEIGSEDEAGAKEQWEAYRNTLNSVAEEGYAYHMVKPGETFYSLSRRFGITEEQLGSLNGGLKPADLKAGAIIKVPGSPEELAAGERQPADTVRADSVPDLSADNRVKEIEFRALRRSATLNVALLLPMDAGTPNPSYLEFYQGFLLGLDSVKTKYGYSVNVCLYNTARDAEKIREITESDAFRNTDLIIGPVYGSVYKALMDDLTNKNIPVIYPLSSRSEEFGVYPDFIQVNPSMKALTVAMSDWLREEAEEANLVCLNLTGNEVSHSDLEDIRLFKEYMHRIGSMNFYDWNTSAVPLDGLRLQLLPDRENIIILPTTKEAEVSKILPVLSALTDGYRITVVGFPEWQAFTSVDHETYFKLHTKIFTYSYVDNTTEPAKRFALKYRKYFYTEPNNLAYKAFDMSLYFIELAAKYRDRTLDALEFYPRNGDFSRFYFQKMEGQAGKENQGFYIVNFGSDYRLKIESL